MKVEKGIRLDPIKTPADLGACWGLHAGFGKYAAEYFSVSQVAIVDQNFARETVAWVNKNDRVRAMTAKLGSEYGWSEAGNLDTVATFDVLLRQLARD